MTDRNELRAVMARVLADQPEFLSRGRLRLYVPGVAGRPAWRKVLSGAALGPAEIVAGLDVPRRLQTTNGEVGTADLPDFLRDLSGRTVYLQAQAGEGKSSFLAQLMHQLADSHIVLTWRPSNSADWTIAEAFREVVASDLPSHGPLPMLIVGELEVAPDGVVQSRLVGDLHEIAVLAETGPVTAVLAGRDSWLRRIWVRKPGELVTLAPFNEEEALAMSRLIARAHDELSAQLSVQQMRTLFPNLARFLRLSTRQQITTLVVPGQPVLVNLLRAVYGEEFYLRLIAEFEDLPQHDQDAYVHVCLATIAAGGITEQLLSKLSTDVDVDSRARQNPWSLTDDGRHVARHAIIAQTVIEEAAGTARIRGRVRSLLAEAAHDDSALPLLEDTLYVISRWAPIAEERSNLTPLQLRKLVRDVVLANGADLDAIMRRICTQPYQLMRWSRLLYLLLPDQPGGSDSTFAALDWADKFLAACLRVAPVNDRSFLIRTHYYQDKLTLLRARALKEDVTVQLPVLTARWGAELDEEWWGPDFYSDVHSWATEVLTTRLSELGTDDYDNDELFTLFSTLVRSFARLNATSTVSVGRLSSHAKLIGRRLHQALPQRRIEVLRIAWHKSVAAGNPIDRAGLQLDRVLAESRVPDDQREAVRRERLAILEGVLDSGTTNAQVVHRLAVLPHCPVELEKKALAVARTIAALAHPGLNLALARHAEGLLTSAEESMRALDAACENYQHGIRD